MKYFTNQIGKSEQALKAKYYALCHELHPDKFPESKRAQQAKIFQEMKAEYEMLKNKQPAPTALDYFAETEKVNKQAQNLFHALTNLNNVDVELLIKTFNEINNWQAVAESFKHQYGKTLIALLISKIEPAKLISPQWIKLYYTFTSNNPSSSQIKEALINIFKK